MRTLTKEAEQKLIAAIERAASLVNEGMEPNDAIIKSAGDANVPAGHVNLMVHAYNTGRTTKQREAGNSTLEKAADFKLADYEKIINALYPQHVKTSAAIKQADAVSTEYAVSPVGFLNRRRGEMQKAAAAAVALPEKTWTPPPRDEHAAMMRAQSEKNAALRAAEELRRNATVAYQKAANALDDLNIYFRTPGNMSFGDALREVGLRLGSGGVSVLQKVAAVYPHFTKQADTGKNHFGDDALYKLVQNVLDNVEAYNDAQGAVPVKKSEAVYKKSAPKFLTESIMNESADEAISLKEAADPKMLGHVAASKARQQQRESDRATLQRAGIDFDQPASTGWHAGDERFRDTTTVRPIVSQHAVDKRLLEMEREDAKPSVESYVDDLFKPWEDSISEHEKRVGDGRAISEKVPEPKNPFTQLADASRDPLKALTAGGKVVGKDLGNLSKTLTKGIGFTTPVKAVGEIIGGGGVGKMLGSVMGTDDRAGGVDKAKEHFKSLTDVEHETALKTIRAKSVLHDLVLNDPVISGHDPHDVTMAFNDIAELAPNLVDSPGVIQSLLRKRLESGSLADFDVKQILEMDKLRAERDKVLAETRDIRVNKLM